MDDGKDLFDTIRDMRRRNLQPEAVEKEIWARMGATRAMLVLDSFGFTRATRAGGIVHFLWCMSSMRDIVRPVFERHGCASPRALADNLFAEFESPREALRAAVEANASVKAEKLMLTESEPYQICVGIGYGRVLQSKTEGVYGEEMNLASKLAEDIAEGGDILLTASAYHKLGTDHGYSFQAREITTARVLIKYYATTYRD